MSVVLFLNGNALVLYEIEYGPDGRVVEATVDNGGWTLKIKGDVGQSCAGSRVVSEFKITSYEEIKVRGHDDYNVVLQRAQAKRDAKSA